MIACLRQSKVIRPALLLGPQRRVVAGCMRLELLFVGVDDLAATVLALHIHCQLCRLVCRFTEDRCGNRQAHTIEVGLGALTGRPFALTGARVPALSALRCSFWICRTVSRVSEGCAARFIFTLSFLEIGMVAQSEVYVQAEDCRGCGTYLSTLGFFGNRQEAGTIVATSH